MAGSSLNWAGLGLVLSSVATFGAYGHSVSSDPTPAYVAIGLWASSVVLVFVVEPIIGRIAASHFFDAVNIFNDGVGGPVSSPPPSPAAASPADAAPRLQEH
jgi:hypothetical protein